jgi:hypothetical protein
LSFYIMIHITCWCLLHRNNSMATCWHESAMLLHMFCNVWIQNTQNTILE